MAQALPVLLSQPVAAMQGEGGPLPAELAADLVAGATLAAALTGVPAALTASLAASVSMSGALSGIGATLSGALSASVALSADLTFLPETPPPAPAGDSAMTTMQRRFFFPR